MKLIKPLLTAQPHLVFFKPETAFQHVLMDTHSYSNMSILQNNHYLSIVNTWQMIIGMLMFSANMLGSCCKITFGQSVLLTNKKTSTHPRNEVCKLT